MTASEERLSVAAQRYPLASDWACMPPS